MAVMIPALLLSCMDRWILNQSLSLSLTKSFGEVEVRELLFVLFCAVCAHSSNVLPKMRMRVHVCAFTERTTLRCKIISCEVESVCTCYSVRV